MSTDSTDVSIKNFEVQNLNNCPENKNYEECIKLQQLLMDGDTNIAFTTNFGSITPLQLWIAIQDRSREYAVK